MPTMHRRVPACPRLLWLQKPNTACGQQQGKIPLLPVQVLDAQRARLGLMEGEMEMSYGQAVSQRAKRPAVVAACCVLQDICEGRGEM